MKRLWISLRLIGFFILSVAAIAILSAIASLWLPHAFGEDLWWNMRTGELESRIYVAGFPVSKQTRTSGTEVLFQGIVATNGLSDRLVFSRSVLQPRIGGLNSRLLTFARVICDSPQFQTNSTALRHDVRNLIMTDDTQGLKTYLESLY